MNVELVPAFDDNYIFFIVDESSKECAVVDPGDPNAVEQYLSANALKLRYILNTHNHWDHVDGIQPLLQKHSASLFSAKESGFKEASKELVGGESLEIFSSELQVLECYGHTKGHIAFYFEKEKWLFCGDTLFRFGCGRIFNGSVESLHQSLENLKKLNPKTSVYCAHEYTLKNLEFTLSLLPDSKVHQRIYQELRESRKNHHSSVPFLLSEALSWNLFMKPDFPGLREALGKPRDCSKMQIFAELRRRRDQF